MTFSVDRIDDRHGKVPWQTAAKLQGTRRLMDWLEKELGEEVRIVVSLFVVLN
jgi:hypothetical protein